MEEGEEWVWEEVMRGGGGGRGGFSVSHDCSLLCFSLLLTMRFARFFLTRRAVSLASPLCTQHCWIILDIPWNTWEGQGGARVGEQRLKWSTQDMCVHVNDLCLRTAKTRSSLGVSLAWDACVVFPHTPLCSANQSVSFNTKQVNLSYYGKMTILRRTRPCMVQHQVNSAWIQECHIAMYSSLITILGMIIIL